MGKEHDIWMEQAAKFWAKKFPDTEKGGPFIFMRMAFPINNKAHLT